MLMAFQFPIALLIGVVLTFAYSMNVHEHPEVNWLIAVAFAIVFDVVVTWLQHRNDKETKTE
jgi:predicted PurR-regulated permease PerM